MHSWDTRYRRADMREQFVDLSVRLHHPYLFAHHGDCEHHIVFIDIKLVQKDDATQSGDPV